MFPQPFLTSFCLHRTLVYPVRHPLLDSVSPPWLPCPTQALTIANPPLLRLLSSMNGMNASTIWSVASTCPTAAARPAWVLSGFVQSIPSSPRPVDFEAATWSSFGRSIPASSSEFTTVPCRSNLRTGAKSSTILVRATLSSLVREEAEYTLLFVAGPSFRRCAEHEFTHARAALLFLSACLYLFAHRLRLPGEHEFTRARAARLFLPTCLCLFARRLRLSGEHEFTRARAALFFLPAVRITSSVIFVFVPPVVRARIVSRLRILARARPPSCYVCEQSILCYRLTLISFPPSPPFGFMLAQPCSRRRAPPRRRLPLHS